MLTLLTKAAGRLQRVFEGKPRTGVEYWEERARKFGKRAVLNIGHKEEEIERITQWQKEILFPLLQTQLNGTETTILDFGCGPGRFTAGLADLIHGSAIGVDPIERFLKLAPQDDRVEYRRSVDGKIPCDDSIIDVVWVCLVLGGLAEAAGLDNATSEILRVLKNGGLLFLVENTSSKPNGPNWHFRSAGNYSRCFRSVSLTSLSSYVDLGETITVMAGRKYV